MLQPGINRRDHVPHFGGGGDGLGGVASPGGSSEQTNSTVWGGPGRGGSQSPWPASPPSPAHSLGTRGQGTGQGTAGAGDVGAAAAHDSGGVDCTVVLGPSQAFGEHYAFDYLDGHPVYHFGPSLGNNPGETLVARMPTCVLSITRDEFRAAFSDASAKAALEYGVSEGHNIESLKARLSQPVEERSQDEVAAVLHMLQSLSGMSALNYSDSTLLFPLPALSLNYSLSFSP